MEENDRLKFSGEELFRHLRPFLDMDDQAEDQTGS